MTNVEAVALALIRDSVKALDQKCNGLRAERDAARADLAAEIRAAEAAADAAGYKRGAEEMRERAAQCSRSGGITGDGLAASIERAIRALPLRAKGEP